MTHSVYTIHTLTPLRRTLGRSDMAREHPSASACSALQLVHYMRVNSALNSIFTVAHGRAFDTFTVCVYPVKLIDVLPTWLTKLLCIQHDRLSGTLWTSGVAPAMASETSIAVASIIYF